MKKILVLEDDGVLNRTLSYNLTQANYEVDSALSITMSKEFMNSKKYDLAILDINLPDGDGFSICEYIKSKYVNTLIIFLTANDMEKDMIKGFDLGADDYITKPFHISVFLKKVKVMLERPERQNGNDVFDDGNLFIDFLSVNASINTIPLTFTPTEYRMLKILIKNPKVVLTRQKLFEKLWDIDENFVDEHTLTSVISRIRNKIEQCNRRYIKTVYGMGYMWIGEDK